MLPWDVDLRMKAFHSYTIYTIFRVIKQNFNIQMNLQLYLHIFKYFIVSQWPVLSVSTRLARFDAGWQPEILSPIARLPAGLYYGNC
jgi:hypothetical protein